MQRHICVIDPQTDFCDPKGALSVPGAHDDMVRLAKMIKKVSRGINDIYVTLDSHHEIHVAHPVYWVNAKGEHPAPFTKISAEDVRNGTWRTTLPSLQSRGLHYVQTLEKNKRYDLTIWPPHCLIGTLGQTVYEPIRDALSYWCKDRFATVNWITKGSNPHTEHYSAVVAEVIDDDDFSTQLNSRFLDSVITADEVLLAGEASSHCVANTVRDAVNYFKDPGLLKKLILLEDCSSPVPTPESIDQAKKFYADMKAMGVRIARSTDF